MFVYAQKDIVLVPFPFTDLSSSKQRPVLIISNNQINGNSQMGDFIGIAITTVSRKTGYSILLEKNDYEKGYLNFDSEAQCSKIATLCKEIVIKKLCSIKDEKFQAVKNGVLEALGFKS